MPIASKRESKWSDETGSDTRMEKYSEASFQGCSHPGLEDRDSEAHIWWWRFGFLHNWLRVTDGWSQAWRLVHFWQPGEKKARHTLFPAAVQHLSPCLLAKGGQVNAFIYEVNFIFYLYFFLILSDFRIAVTSVWNLDQDVNFHSVWRQFPSGDQTTERFNSYHCHVVMPMMRLFNKEDEFSF